MDFLMNPAYHLPTLGLVAVVGFVLGTLVGAVVLRLVARLTINLQMSFSLAYSTMVWIALWNCVLGLAVGILANNLALPRDYLIVIQLLMIPVGFLIQVGVIRYIHRIPIAQAILVALGLIAFWVVIGVAAFFFSVAGAFI